MKNVYLKMKMNCNFNQYCGFLEESSYKVNKELYLISITEVKEIRIVDNSIIVDYKTTIPYRKTKITSTRIIFKNDIETITIN